MSARREGPPRLARALLEALSPEDAWSAVGDLEEEYERFVRPERGRSAAGRWYWRQVLLSIPGLLWRRATAPGAGIPGFASELRLAARFLRRRPAFTVAAAGTLALGLGVNTVVFGVAHAVLLRPLPYDHEAVLVRPIPDELFFLNATESQLLPERMTTFEDFAAWGRSLFLLSGDAGAEEVRGARVGWNHFDVLGARPLLGRTFARRDAETGDALILSHGLWTRRFGGDPAAVGREIDVGGRRMTIVGVMSADHVPLEHDWEAWSTLPLDPALMEGMGLAGTGRLRQGVSLAQATDELRRVLPEIWSRSGDETTAEEAAELQLAPVRIWLLGDARMALGALTAAVGLVLLLACVNVAALALAQSRARAREFAVRVALGGAPSRLSRQVLAELIVVAALGAVGGVAGSFAAFSWLRAHIPAEIPRVASVGLSPTVVAFAFAATVVVALLSALVPARRARNDGAAVARSGGTATGTREVQRLRSLLVASEVAVAVVLVIGAGLMLRTFSALRAVDPGFQTEGAVTVRTSPPSDRYPGGAELEAYYAEVSEALAAVPGVSAVGAIQFLPMTPGGWWSAYRTSPAPDEEDRRTAVRVVRAGYFEAMRIPLVAGRTIREEDGRSDGPVRVVVNETFAREAFGTEPAVGRVVGMFDQEIEIVGVVGDVRQTDVREDSHAEAYIAFGLNPWRRLHLVARVQGDAREALSGIGEAVRAVDPGVVLQGPRLLGDVVGSTWADTRLLTALLALFGAVGLGLGAVGVYGVAAQSALERRREIGIRLTLGASVRGVARRAVARGMLPVLSGVGVGLLVATFAVRLLRGLLYGVPDLDPATWIAAPSVLIGVAVLSLWVPSHLASRVDPVRTLRDE